MSNSIASTSLALKRAYSDGYNKQDLYTREDVADQYGSPYLEYMPGPQGWRSPEYDHDSIMHYPSQAHADVYLVTIDPNNPDFYPLVRLSGAERKKKIIFPPEEGFEISAGDVGAIRDMYPW